MGPAVELHSVACHEGHDSYPAGVLCVKNAFDSAVDLQAQTAVFNHAPADDPLEAARQCAARQPWGVGISLYLWSVRWLECFARELKRLAPKTVVFAGGPHAPAYLDEYPDFLDFGVVGEGEVADVEAVRQLAAGKPEPHVPGVFTATRRTDVGSAPLAALDDYGDVYERNRDFVASDGVVWEIARGCPNRCTYCAYGNGHGLPVELSDELIVRQLQLFDGMGLAHVYVSNPTFNYSLGKAKHVARLIVEHSTNPLTKFYLEIQPTLMDDELAALLARMNAHLELGLQSANPQVLRTIRRPFDRKKFERCLQLLNAHRLDYGVDTIIGLPLDSFDSYCHTIDYLAALDPPAIYSYPLLLLPGTQLAREAEQWNFELYDASDDAHLCQVKATPTFAHVEFALAETIADSYTYLRFRRSAPFRQVPFTQQLRTSLRDDFAAMVEERRASGALTPEAAAALPRRLEQFLQG